MTCCTRILVLLVGVVLASTAVHARTLQQAKQAPTYDCKKGCPAVTSLVCAAGDITLQSECLAFCQKLRVKHDGACSHIDGSGRVSGEDRVAAAFAPANPDDGASPAAAPLQITTQAMNRFRRDGFVCIGQAAGSPAFKPDRQVLTEGNMPSQRPTPGPNDLRAIRVSAGDNLMYIERSNTTALRLASALASNATARFTAGNASPPGKNGTAAAAMSPAQGFGLTGPAFPVAVGEAQTPADVVAAQVPSNMVIRFSAAFPYAAIGRLDINGGTCSASQIGDFTILSAAHCIYNRTTRTFATSRIQYEPATFTDSRGTRQFPYGTNPLSYYTYLNGYVNEADNSRAHWYDIVVLTLRNTRRTGTLGFAWDPAGYGGWINWAGYPAETQPRGTYRWGNCNIVNDNNGKDSRLAMQGNGMRCLVMERGESGSPIWENRNNDHFIRAVESHGSFATGVEIDIGTELDEINYNFVANNRNNRPR